MGHPTRVMFIGMLGSSFLFGTKKHRVTMGEVIKVALESLVLFTIWIVWIAPQIWHYTHSVELNRYFQLSLLYWTSFMIPFIIGAVARREGIRIQKFRERIRYDDKD
ncbi:MAG: hypothetical protein F6J87_27390 [Spirulina sp. SIO3F2]|nr:hypothetical protein [Spirulina sp. SIO3F2]